MPQGRGAAQRGKSKRHGKPPGRPGRADRAGRTEERYVLLDRPEGPTPDDPSTQRRWWQKLKREQRKRVKTRPIVRIADDEVDWGSAPGPDDEVGYGMRPYARDDCFRAAIATAVQAPIEEVPDLKLHHRFLGGEDPMEINRRAWEAIGRWAEDGGYVPMFWDDDELPVPRDRWIGVIKSPSRAADSPFADHCLVMCHDSLVFDPACSAKALPGTQPLRLSPSLIEYGITFERKEDH